MASTSVDIDPPAYTPPAAPHRSVVDLRAQIIANGSIMRPKNDPHRAADDHLEVLLAKAPAARPNQPGQRNTHWSEKQAMEMAKGAGSRVASQSSIPSAPAPSSSAASPSMLHYAVLIKRSSSGNVNIILRGEAKETVEEALEWMLERTEMMVHDIIVRKGRQAEEDCCVM